MYWKGKLGYAGKALHTTLNRRLAEHPRQIAGRKHITVSRMTRRVLTIESD